MKLEGVIANLDSVKINGNIDVDVTGIVYDSRLVKSGNLFVAISGHKVCGTEYITQALSNGATVVVSENDLNLGKIPHIQVKCARTALAVLSSSFYEDVSKSLNVIGITGTNGKTTTSYLVRNMLRYAGLPTGLIGTVAYEVGERSIPASRTTPEAPEIHSLFSQMKALGCNHVVMEVSSHAIVLHRVHGIHFNTCVFTNLTQDHLDYHNDMESYFSVKAKLFQPNHSTVINMDDPWGRRLIQQSGIQACVLSYGFDESADIYASEAVLTENGTRFNVSTPWGSAEVRMKLLGRFNIHNTLAAIGVGGLNGLSLDRMVEALEFIPCIPGRLELVPNRKNRKIFVDYAHTDDALKNVLTTLREICKGRLIVVFGCGGNRDKGKREKMGRVAAELADISIVTSDNPRDEDPAAIIGKIMTGFEGVDAQYEVVLDRRVAIEMGVNLMGAKDILLIAGKGHETYQEVKGAIIPFDDREIVQEIF